VFDECGAIIVADDELLLDLILNEEWKELFCDNREEFGKRIQCSVVCHDMHENALTPYIGRTAQTLLLKQDGDFFKKKYSEQLKEVDQIISDLWLKKISNKRIENPKDLQPFPLLGMPGWWNKQQDESFYLNDEYFRGKSRAKSNY